QQYEWFLISAFLSILLLLYYFFTEFLYCLIWAHHAMAIIRHKFLVDGIFRQYSPSASKCSPFSLIKTNPLLKHSPLPHQPASGSWRLSRPPNCLGSCRHLSSTTIWKIAESKLKRSIEPP
ncbi:hypothetical protein DH86_00002298, partial [Scytalidium sp. 3C]